MVFHGISTPHAPPFKTKEGKSQSQKGLKQLIGCLSPLNRCGTSMIQQMENSSKKYLFR